MTALVFTAPGPELAAAVRYAARWLVGRPAMPAHACLLFELTDERLSISGFNEYATGRATLDVDAPGGQTGSFVVSGRLLDQLVGTFGKAPVIFESDGTSAVSLSSGRWSGTVPVLSVKDYPGLPGEATLAGYISGAALADAVHRVAAAASRDASKQIELTGVHLAFGDETIRFMATDRYRGARMVVPWEPAADSPALGKFSLVMSAPLLDAAEGFAVEESVAIGRDEWSFSLTSPSRSLVVRVLDQSRFAGDGLAQIFDQDRPAAVSLSVADLTMPLKRAAMLWTDKPELANVTIQLAGNLMTVGAKGEINQGDDQIDVTYGGPDASLAIRVATLQGMLQTAPGDTITMAFTPNESSPRPAIITAPADLAWRHILVPLRKA